MAVAEVLGKWQWEVEMQTEETLAEWLAWFQIKQEDQEKQAKRAQQKAQRPNSRRM